ncbi:hypothetical protein DFQ26_002071 [Actinomortierella ambigua]|nr:hypothetical protein DFQ26_002071 [Actinomortierella ambigua]
MASHTPPVEVPVDQIDFSPHVGTEAGDFFQTDADLARAAARAGMVNYDKGQAIKIASKVLDMCPARHGTMFLAESGHIARKLHLETGKTLKTYHGHIGPVTKVVVYYTAEGQERLLTGSWDKTIKVWDAESKTCLATLQGHTDFIKALVLRPVWIDTVEGEGEGEGEGAGATKTAQRKRRLKYELFSASYDGTIRHWDLDTFAPALGGRGGAWKGHVRGVNDLYYVNEIEFEDDEDDYDDNDDDNNGKGDRSRKTKGSEYLYSAGSDGTVRKWDILKGQGQGGHCDEIWNYHATTVYRVIVQGNEIWSASADKTVQRFDLETKKVDTKIEHPDFVKTLALAGPYVLTGGREESVRVLSVATGKLIKEIKGHFDEVSSIVVIGTTAYTGSLDGTMRRWSMKEQDLKASHSTLTNATEDQPRAFPLSSSTASVHATAGTKLINVPTDVAAAASTTSADAAPIQATSMLTAEEEAELAELMSDDD